MNGDSPLIAVNTLSQDQNEVPYPIFGGIVTEANTGENDVDGGGQSGHRDYRTRTFDLRQRFDRNNSNNDGGDVEDSGDDNTGGNGGRSGDGGDGGVIVTAPANALTDIANKINTVVNNILR